LRNVDGRIKEKLGCTLISVIEGLRWPPSGDISLGLGCFLSVGEEVIKSAVG
jgi:hypothetical protein